jgi:cytochrome c oxidase subunit 4
MTTAEIESAPASAEHPEAAHEQEHHPLPYQYVFVAVFLAFVTGAEVGLYYVKALRVDRPAVYVLILMVMMFTKFATVAAWFMHLRFDSRIFRRLFVTGIILASMIYFAVLLSLHVLIGD